MIGVKVSQFRVSKDPWDPKDGSCEVQRRYWAIVELKEIVKDNVTKSLYKNLLKKWREGVESREL